jgi:hypothetical protein
MSLRALPFFGAGLAAASVAAGASPSSDQSATRSRLCCPSTWSQLQTGSCAGAVFEDESHALAALAGFYGADVGLFRVPRHQASPCQKVPIFDHFAGLFDTMLTPKTKS